MISDTELQALIDAEAKATKGEWTVGIVDESDYPEGTNIPPQIDLRCNGSWWSKIVNTVRIPDGDAHFIASLRNAAPSLLAELRASREIIATLCCANSESLATRFNQLDEESDEGSTLKRFLDEVSDLLIAQKKAEAALASKGER